MAEITNEAQDLSTLPKDVLILRAADLILDIYLANPPAEDYSQYNYNYDPKKIAALEEQKSAIMPHLTNEEISLAQSTALEIMRKGDLATDKLKEI